MAVLPALVDGFETVTVGIENVRSVITEIVIKGMHDAERLESRLVKCNRSIEILDGYEDVVEQEFTSFVGRLIGFHKND